MTSFQEELVIGTACLTGAWLFHHYGALNLAESGTIGQNQAGVYIQLLASALALCGVVCFLKAALRYTQGAKVSKPLRLKRITAVALVMATYIIMLSHLGFFIATTLTGIALLFIMGEKSRGKLLIYPCCFATLLYLLFAEVLQVQLPALPFS